MDHAVVPARDWPVGAKLPAEAGNAVLDQVSHTLSFYWTSAISPENIPIPGCDSMMNERGVFVTMNFGGRPGTKESEANLLEGGVRDQLLRVIAERASSARHGMELAAAILEKYGQSRPCGWIWVIADKDEAWVVQSMLGRHYASVRVSDDEVAVIPNVLTVRELPCPGFDAGHSSADVRNGIDDFSRRFQRKDWFMNAHSVSRYRQCAGILLDKPYLGEVRFSLKPKTKVGVETVKRMLSSHAMDGEARHSEESGPVCRDQTAESTVCEMGGETSKAMLYVTSGPPCSNQWKAWNPFGQGLPEGVSMKHPCRRLDEQFDRKKTYSLED